jgi:hypothetical protein
MNKINTRKALNPAYRKHKPLRKDVNIFTDELLTCLKSIKEIDNANESEEHIKEPIKNFFNNTFYKDNYINTKSRIDLAIFLGKDIKSDVGVIIETKKPSNKSEFLTNDNINKKALQELLLYYLRERIDKKNNNIKHLIATNGYEWYLFKSEDFYSFFYKNKNLVKEYEEFRDGKKDSTNTELFYNEIAKKYIDEVEKELPYVYLDFTKKSVKEYSDAALNTLYKIFSDVHFLSSSFGNDSNQLNKTFYNELLHIIGLEEIKVKGKKLINRKIEKDRDDASILENAIFTIEDRDYLNNIKSIESGNDKAFNAGVDLTLTWINRILFLKLLESQLLTYHKQNKEYSFLNSDFIKGYDDLNDLFFSALAKKVDERHPKYKERFKYIPYLNSSLFERTKIENEAFTISALHDEDIKIYNQTVLKDNNGKRLKGKLSTLDYLLQFLDAYNFATDGTEGIEEEKEDKTLINASVLGLIFEKINGYKEGSFYTPAYITMYMSKETLRRAVVQKFKEQESEQIETFEDLKAYTHRFFKPNDLKRFNKIINSIRIVDPAVGSGHFLVSALNELISIKSELKILIDENGNSLRSEIIIDNDELYITDEQGHLLDYKPGVQETALIQKTLFHEKQNLIENSLFGVDINPNSVKICRLRLWIELLKNAYYTEENQLQTLPNIDINIKVGNSLISRFGLDDDLKSAFKDKDVKYSFADYKNAVAEYKNTNDKSRKNEVLQIIDEVKNNFRSTLGDKEKNRTSKARGEIVNIESEINRKKQWGEKTSDLTKTLKKAKELLTKLEAQKDEILNNKIYHNAFEWRFEFPEVLDEKGNYIGFDVVIGNPPYGVSINEPERKSITNILGKVPDFEIYYYFINRGHKILRIDGELDYIVPNTILFNVFATKYRLDLINKWKVEEILDCTNFEIFNEAKVRNIILSLKNTEHKDNYSYRNTNQIDNFQELITNTKILDSTNTLIEFKQNWSLVFKLEKEKTDLIRKIRNKSTKLLLDLFPNVGQGLIAYDKYQGQSKELIKNRVYHSFDYKEGYKEWLYGGDITPYVVEWNKKEYINYCDGIANPRLPFYFKGERLLIREITNPKIYCAKTEKEQYNDPALIIIHSKDKTDNLSLNALMGYLNSRLLTFYHFNFSPKATKGLFPKVLVGDIKQIPIIDGIGIIEKQVIQILDLKKTNTKADTSEIEKEIDYMVYKLYELTDEEIAIVENSIN